MRAIRLKAVADTVSIARDSHGVPRVRANSWRDALFALGWLHARDRGAQMFLARAVGQGRVCELLRDDDALLQVDVYFRHFGFARDAREHIGKLPSPYAQYLAAYVEGVNRRWGKRRPAMLRLLGLNPEPFEPADVLLLAKLMSFAGLAEAQRIGELFIVEALRRGVDAKRLAVLFPGLDAMDESMIRNLSSVPPMFPGARAESHLPLSGGSNAWVVAGHRSHSGAPLIANDPHLEVNRLPPIFYETELSVDDHWVKGATIPGTYSFVVGRTPHLAWGVTYSCADTSDFFAERCKGERYLRDGTWCEFRRRRERILRKKHAPHEVTLHQNEHGILEGDARTDGDYLSWNWVGLGPGGLGVLRALIDLIHCNSVEQAQKTVRQIDIPTLHMTFADRHGNIGYQFAGTVPRRRKGWSGLTPQAGWNPANDWQGQLDPRHETLHELNPARGHIVITNEARQCIDGPRLATIWLSDYRRLRIEQMLAERDGLTLEDMQRIHYDLVSLQAERFLPEYLCYLPPDPQRELLEHWDGRYTADSLAATLFEAIHQEVVIEVFGGGGFGRQWMRYLIGQTNLYSTMIGFFDEVLMQKDSVWLPAKDRATRLEVAVRAGLARSHDSWGMKNAVLFRNLLLGGRLPRFLGFDRGPKPLPGNHATVHQGTLLNLAGYTSSFAPAYHFVSDLSDDAVWTNLPGGPSESRFSRWYSRGLDYWLRGKYKLL